MSFTAPRNIYFLEMLGQTLEKSKKIAISES